MTADELIAGMRALGVRSIELEPSGERQPSQQLVEPDGLETDGAPPAQKPDGSCSHPGCMTRSGFYYAPQYCEAHGLAALGVKGVAVT